MSTKHTPGPWNKVDGAKGYLGQKESEMRKTFFVHTSFKEITNGPQAEIVECKYDTQAAQMGNSDFQHTITKEEAEANAKLIAAAPDMLTALDRMLVAETWEQIEAAKQWAAKAIKKATE